MSMAEEPPKVRPRRRTTLPAELSEDELARNWSLTAADLEEISCWRSLKIEHF
jgi:hypothetical protein